MEILKGKANFLTSEKLKGVIHGFSMREGGVSEGDFGSLNVGLRRGDNPFNAIKNIEICADTLHLTKENLTLTYQTHTANVRLVEEEDIGKGFIKEWGEGVDGIVTGIKNVPLMCYSADCVPILLYAEKGLIGAVHSGWKGTAANIIKNAVELMVEKGGKCENIKVFIGPAIGMCCYEVSFDVAEAFTGYPQCVISKPDGKYMVDLKMIVKKQAEECGVREENIDMCNICTSCSNDMFFSHRKQKGRSGLLGGFIELVEE